jgi:dihydrodipicolinate synthase/N-acetylneuraminate lyase
VKNVKNISAYVYNNPKFQGYPLNLKVLQRMKSLGVNGVKDATFDSLAHATYHRVLKDTNFDIVLGTKAMWFSARVLGTEAYIPGLVNAFVTRCNKKAWLATTRRVGRPNLK